MKKCLSALVIALFVMVTTMPSYSQAMVGDHATKAEVLGYGDCHKAVQADKSVHHEKDNSGKDCCDKGMCKCVGGSCHGMSKIFGNGNNSLAAVSTDSTVFAFDNQFVESALANRLKRPPKA